MPGSGMPAWEHPALAPRSAPCMQNLDDATTHRNKSSPLGGLAVGDENHAVLPIEIFDAHAVEFPLVSHSRVAHQDDDVAEKLKGSPSPGAGLSSFEQLSFCFIVKPKMRPMSLHHFDFWSMADHLPLLRFVKHSSQCPQSAVGVSDPGNFNCSAKSPVIWLTRKPATGVAFSSRQPLR